MAVIYFLIPISILIAISFLIAFLWAVKTGQYEDVEGPPIRLVLEEENKKAEYFEQKD